MIVDEDELELVNTTRMHGKAELSHYFVNNSKLDDWHLVAGTVKGRSAVLVFDPHAPAGSRRSFKLTGFAAGTREGRNDQRFPPRALGDEDAQSRT